ncbi:MAG: amidohydrolase [Chloroflexi bacterium RBG_16_48_8]|nr:MAG: amidohydrolase [Chloroflexi bacterium RBG_16_48_8]
MAEADIILRDANIVTMNSSYQIIPDGAVAIKGEEILAVGKTSDILTSYVSTHILGCQGKALLPGLINAHTHAPMTLLRGLTDDQRLDVWLLGYMMPVEREFVSPEFCDLGTRIACAEMIRGGTTTFADMFYFEDSIANAAAQIGMRAICGQTVLKFPSPDAESYEDALNAARLFIQKWKDHPLIIPAIAPHSAYNCTEDILLACTEIAVKFDVPILTHIAETRLEEDQWRQTYDMPVVPWLKKLGFFEAKVIAAHCVHVDSGEIHTLEHFSVGVIHNPSSNLKLASGFAPIIEMLSEGLCVGIGTDGPASNNDLDMFEEVRLASLVAKAVTNDPTALPARTAFAMVTILGAKALKIDHLTGSIEAGKRADLILVDLNTLHAQPAFAHDPDSIYSRLIYAAKSFDVTHVMVNGRWLMRDRVLETIQEAPLLEAANDYAKRIDVFLIEREGSVLSKLIAIGDATQGESYEVQIKVRIPDTAPILEKLTRDHYEIIRTAHYLEYDTYFTFDAPSENRLRYREDEFVDEKGNVFNVRYRLTLIGPAAEHSYPNFIFLSRSRFIAPAIHSLRFYREYFKPSSENEINKDRLRWLIRYKGEDFFINVDTILQPKIEGHFLEIKSRTWSRVDAEEKAKLIPILLEELVGDESTPVEMEYPEIALSEGKPQA